MSAVTIASYAVGAVASAIIIGWPIALVKFRRVVPTNMVHIVQRNKTTTPYGRSSKDGNTYYEWPEFLPKIGVKVTEFPESIFEVALDSYETYDSKNLPFSLDVSAFFRLEDSATAAQRVANFKELKEQLSRVLQGAVRRLLSQHSLVDIMKMRSELGESFTAEVRDQVTQWGVVPVKALEVMNIGDVVGSTVVADIKSVETARINKDSRVAVADNARAAKVAEIEANRAIQLADEEARQKVGERQAEVQRTVGLAGEKSAQEVAAARRVTTEAEMAVRQVADTKAAEIAKSVAVTNAEAAAAVLVKQAEADANVVEKNAQAQLTAAQRSAEGQLATGKAAAEAHRLMLEAPVTTQLQLADGIGANESYQNYLIRQEQVKADKDVGMEMAKAIGNAKLTVMATGGANDAGSVMDGVNGLARILSPKTGTQMAGMATAMSATPEGQQLLDGLAQSNLTSVAAGAAVANVTGNSAAGALTAAAMAAGKKD